MTTARERAREAIERTLGASPPTGARVLARDAADAASDVWEPIVRDLLAYAEAIMEDPDDSCITQAKEALG